MEGKPSRKEVSIKSKEFEAKWGGESSYTDADVVWGKSYMTEVLEIDALTINGRVLEHIIAEIRGFAHKEANLPPGEIARRAGYVTGLQQKLNDLNAAQIIERKLHYDNINHLRKELAQVKSELKAEMTKPKYQDLRVEQIVTETSRRIKEDF